jgi:hypothetical protein
MRRHGEVLGAGKARALIDMISNWIGAKRAGRLAGVLGVSQVLAHLDLRDHMVGEEAGGV